MKILIVLILSGLAVITVKSEDRERTFIELKQIRKVDSVRGSSQDKGRIYKEKEVIKTYHHIIKKILPPYPGDQTSEKYENTRQSTEKQLSQRNEDNSSKILGSKGNKIMDHKLKTTTHEPLFGSSSRLRVIDENVNFKKEDTRLLPQSKGAFTKGRKEQAFARRHKRRHRKENVALEHTVVGSIAKASKIFKTCPNIKEFQKI